MAVPPDSPLGRPEPPRKPALRAGRLIIPIFLFVLLGIPLVAYAWNTLNLLVAGHFEPARVIFGLIALIGIALLLRILARTVAVWEATRFD